MFSPSRILLVLVSALLGMAAWLSLPGAHQSQELGLSRVIAKHTDLVRPRANDPMAKKFCESVSGGTLTVIDCRRDHTQLSQTADSPQLTQFILFDTALQVLLRDRQDQLERLRAALTQEKRKDSLLALQLLLEKRLALISAMLDPHSTKSSVSHSEVFNMLLEVDGYRYDLSTGKFSPLRYDVIRALEAETNFVGRTMKTRWALTLTPFFIFLFSVVWLYFSLRTEKKRFLILTLGFLALSNLGILICADAAIRFGAVGTSFVLNPLSSALPNQLFWMALMTIFSLVTMVCISRFDEQFVIENKWASQGIAFYKRLKLVHLVSICIITIFSAYHFFSPAIGAETLKIVICGLSGVLLAQHGRAVFLVQKYIPGGLSILSFWHSIRHSNAQLDTSGRIHRLFLKPYAMFLSFGLSSVAATALIFGDFGGTAVAVSIVLSFILLLYGWQLFIASFVFGGLIAVAAMQTEKVQDRLALMFEPANANVSDFARLIAFEEYQQPLGQGLGSIHWCNEVGVCVPLQILSDYIPTLISAVLGRTLAITIFLLILLASVVFAYQSLRAFAATTSRARILPAIAFFLFLSVGIQTVITFFGNWRLLPLTGLGLPFASIGISSIAAGYLALSLLFGFSIMEKRRFL